MHPWVPMGDLKWEDWREIALKQIWRPCSTKGIDAPLSSCVDPTFPLLCNGQLLHLLVKRYWHVFAYKLRLGSSEMILSKDYFTECFSYSRLRPDTVDIIRRVISYRIEICYLIVYGLWQSAWPQKANCIYDFSCMILILPFSCIPPSGPQRQCPNPFLGKRNNLTSSLALVHTVIRLNNRVNPE